jgi:hypothetical protein
MDLNKYGPFADIVAIIFGLAALFSTLVARAIGGIKQWTDLMGDTSPFLVLAGPRAVAVVLIAISFLTLTPSTVWFFIVLAVIAALITFVNIPRFNRDRAIYTCEVREVATDGSQAVDAKGVLKKRRLIIGSEEKLLPHAKRAFDEARKQNRGLSLCAFLGGFGSSEPYDASAAWSREELANIAKRLFTQLTWIVLAAVLALYWAAAIVEIKLRTG